MPTTPSAQVRSLCRGSRALTHGFRVSVVPAHRPEESDPLLPRHIFSYRITIKNEDGPAATLRSRRWAIIDAHGRREDVEGEGVVGRRPRLEPGESFTYESFCPLRTRWGTMEGAYVMETDEGEVFEISVARFYLAAAE